MVQLKRTEAEINEQLDQLQKLIDIMFEVAITINKNSKSFQHLDNEELAEWVAKQLKACGFPTEPVGSSWGVLINKDK